MLCTVRWCTCTARSLSIFMGCAKEIKGCKRLLLLCKKGKRKVPSEPNANVEGNKEEEDARDNLLLGKRKEEDTMRELGGGSSFSIEEVRGRVRAFERRGGGEGTLEVGHFHKTDTTLSKRIRSEREKSERKRKKRKVSRSLLHLLSVLLLGLSLFFSASIPPPQRRLSKGLLGPRFAQVRNLD